MREKIASIGIVFTVFLVVSALTAVVNAQEVAPDFTLTDIDWKEFSLSDYRGKIVILDFFFIL